VKRRNKILVGLGLAVFLLAATVGVAYYSVFERSAAWRGEAADLDTLLANWAGLGLVPGVILQVEGPDGPIYRGAAGTLSTDGGDPVSPDTPFHTASVGKLFTAATVLRLHERGVLDIDKPAAAYVGDETVAGLVVVDGEDLSGQITIRQLLCHRAGLGNTDDDLRFQLGILSQPGRRRAPRELLDHARRIGAVGPPGAQTSYASPGYFLLGLVIEAAAGMPYHEAVRQETLEPLGMANTFEATHEWPKDAPFLRHHVSWIDFGDFDPSFEFADGGYVTTAADLIVFGKALIQERLFKQPDTHALFLSRPPGAENARGYAALGPHVYHPERGGTAVYHGGFWGVFLVAYPENGVVAAMTLAQSNADLGLFWGQARQILARDKSLLK